MPRLLLINPSGRKKVLGNIRATAFPPLNLPYLAAVTPEHYRIEVLDENVEPFAYREADIVGITAYTSSAYRAYQISGVYQKKGIPTVIGGIHASMRPQEALQYCDTVVTGEAEDIWPTVLRDFESASLQPKYEGQWACLDNLPFPRRDILLNPRYRWGSIQTSRGCPMNCSFCSVTAFNGRRFRRRPLDAVIEELLQIPQKRIMITDDNIIGHGERDLEWTRRFFARILEKGIKKTFFAQVSIQLGEHPDLVRLAARAGLKIVLTGVESVNPATLKNYHKDINLRRLNQDRYAELIERIRKGGIAFLGAFVLGSDQDDRRVFQATLDFIRSSHIDVIQVTKPTPLPGTRLWEELQRDNRIIDQDFPKAWNEYRLSTMLFRPEKLTIEEVYMGFTHLRKVYYGFWETVKRTLCTLRDTRSVIATVIAFAFNASYQKAFRRSRHFRRYHRMSLERRFRERPIDE